MSTYKYLDDDGLLYVKQKLDTKFASKVDTETGKGLSTNDYTTAEKNKLSGIASGAQVNVIESIKVNGTAQTITSKAVDITVPTNNNQLTNGAGYITSSAISGKEDTTNKVTSIDANSTDSEYPSAKAVVTYVGDSYTTLMALINGKASKSTTLAGYGITNAYTKTETDTAIADAISGITGISFEIVATLPSTGNAGTIYLVSNSGSSPNIYDEYIYVSNSWEKIGTTDVDLSGYVQATELVAITNAEIDTIFG